MDCENLNLTGLGQMYALACFFLDGRFCDSGYCEHVSKLDSLKRCYCNTKFIFITTDRQKESHKHLYPRVSRHVRNVCACVYVHALLPPDGHYQICVSLGCSLCPHVFHYYLIAANKQFMPLNWGNTLYPDTRLSNHLDFRSLSSSSCGKQNSWRWATDNTEAHYLLHAR